MSDEGDRGSAKRYKSSTGTPVSAPLRVTPTAVSLPRYQPPNGAARVSPTTANSSASLSRTQGNGSPSLKFTIKAPPSKLRQATSGAHYSQHDPYKDEQVSSSAAPASRSVRSTRNPRAVVEPDSDDDEPMDDDDDLEPELTGEGFDEDDEDMNEDEDAEGEEDDEDIVASHPPPPRIQQTTNVQGRPKVKVSAPHEGALQSVEAKEIEDEDLSDLDSDDEGQQDTALGIDDDDELDSDEDDDDDEDDEDIDGSRSATPDLSKLTRRQRGQYEEIDTGGLMALSNEAQKKKHISAEEHVMRRAEMARRRKNLSEKRNEEEKIDTINKLLKKPAPKRRTRAEMLAAQANSAGTPGADGEEGDHVPADPVYVRWINSAAGSTLSIPVEWLQSPAGEALASAGQQQARSSADNNTKILVEEVA